MKSDFNFARNPTSSSEKSKKTHNTRRRKVQLRAKYISQIYNI